MSARKRRSRDAADGYWSVGSTSKAVTESSKLDDGSSALADAQKTMRVRQLPVGSLPFVRRWLAMSSLEVSQGVLPTQNGR